MNKEEVADYPSPPIQMERTDKILRRSIHTFLQNYQHFTSTAALLTFPFSASILLSQILVPSSSLLPPIQTRLRSLFKAASFPPSEFFSLLSLKLSQTIVSSILVLPFTLSFLLFARANTIQALKNQQNSYQKSLFFSFLSTYIPMFITQLCNSILILSANATSFSLLFLAFNFLENFRFSSPSTVLFLSAAGAVFYSVILANVYTITSLAIVISGVENTSGWLSILKACVVITNGRTATALSLALPVNLALAAVEALFHYRVLGPYIRDEIPIFPLVSEGIFIGYLYSILIVLDTVVGFVFFRSCRGSCQIDMQDTCSYRIGIDEADGIVKNFEDDL